jgi:hypothetical protein
MNTLQELNALLKGKHHSYRKDVDRRFPTILNHPIDGKMRVEDEAQYMAAIDRGYEDIPKDDPEGPHANDDNRKKFLKNTEKRANNRR